MLFKYEPVRINEIENILLAELSKVELRLNTDKLIKCDWNSEFDYLGFTHSKDGISVSDASLKFIKSNYCMLYEKYPKYPFN